MAEMNKLIPAKIVGISNEAEHHKIAAKLSAMSDRWDKIELQTGIRPPEAFDYSFGLVMGELIFAALPKDRDILKQKINTEIVAVRVK